MVIAIQIFFDNWSFAFDELLEVKDGPVPEFYHAGKKAMSRVFLSMVRV